VMQEVGALAGAQLLALTRKLHVMSIHPRLPGQIKARLGRANSEELSLNHFRPGFGQAKGTALIFELPPSSAGSCDGSFL